MDLISTEITELSLYHSSEVNPVLKLNVTGRAAAFKLWVADMELVNTLCFLGRICLNSRISLAENK
jgi:hypothetical protein